MIPEGHDSRADGDSATADEPSPTRGTGAARLTYGTVNALSGMIKDLEEQLDRMLAINGTLERDLQVARTRNKELERKVDESALLLRRAEQEAVARDDMLAQISHLSNERARLARTIDELSNKNNTLEGRRDDHSGEVERLRAGRADAIEELHSVEAQFERAMKMVSDVKTSLAVMSEEYEALRGRLRITDDKVRETEEHRDSLLAEVEESRTALEEIRRSLVDACVASQHRFPEDEG